MIGRVGPNILAAAGMLLMGGGVFAQDTTTDTGWYLGYGTGQFTAKNSFSQPSISTSFDTSSEGFIAGYRFSPNFAVESQYFSFDDESLRFSSPSDSGVAVLSSASGFGIYAKPKWPISERFGLYAKLGWARFESDVTITFDAQNSSIVGKFRTKDYSFGAGAEYQLTDRLKLDFGYTERKSDVFDIRGWGLSLLFEF